MDLRKVKKLIELLEESALVEMEISEGDNTIRLSRAHTTGTPVAQTGPTPTVPTQYLEPAVSASITTESNTLGQSTEVQSGSVVESPMVGTYYDSPSPDADPFVKVGSRVKKGDTLCIVEAMKTFNQIDAETDGTIKAIHKSSGDPVEFGEPLFTIA